MVALRTTLPLEGRGQVGSHGEGLGGLLFPGRAARTDLAGRHPAERRERRGLALAAPVVLLTSAGCAALI